MLLALTKRAGVTFETGLGERLDLNEYQNLVVAIIGAAGFVLAMFFSSVAVIASTSYHAVPGEIRRLFVEDRSSRLFTRSVLRTLVLGLLVLSMEIVVGRQPPVLAVVVLVTLAGFSVVSLVALGNRLFDFFDLSSLSQQLPQRFAGAIRTASVARSTGRSEAREALGHSRAAEVLGLYGQLTTLLAERGTNEVAAPTRILYQLVSIVEQSALQKGAVPSDSPWFERVPAHANWLTANHNQLGLALETQTALRPDLVPDPLWVERRATANIRRLLSMLTAAGAWSTTIGVADRIVASERLLASRLRLEEAELLHAALTASLREATEYRPTSSDPASSSGPDSISRLAAAERSIKSLTSIWLGVVAAAGTVTAEAIRRWSDRAVESSSAPYRMGAPRHVLEVCEGISAGVSLERRTEARQITPSWWIHHFVARAWAREFIDATQRVLDLVESELHSTAQPPGVELDAELAALTAFEALELLSKLETHLPTINRALRQLAELRADEASDDRWPDTDEVSAALVAETRKRVLVNLTEVVVHLESDAHDGSRPDLFGQAYKVLFNVTFEALLGGDTELSGALLPTVMSLANDAQSRLATDLSEERNQTRFIYWSEPLVSFMELSGYALFMEELDGVGSWGITRALWDSLMAEGGSTRAAGLVEIVDTLDSIFALTPGGLERTSRQMRLEAVMRSRGLDTSPYGSPFGQRSAPSHPSALVRAMRVRHSGADLVALFIVEYLLKQPGCEGLEISAKADSLRRRIQRERERGDETTASNRAVEDLDSVDDTRPDEPGDEEE